MGYAPVLGPTAEGKYFWLQDIPLMQAGSWQGKIGVRTVWPGEEFLGDPGEPRTWDLF